SLQRGRRRLVVHRGLTQPFLSCTQVAASEQEAPVLIRARPLRCPDGQARVRVPPAEVFFKCRDYIVESALQIMARAEEDPVRCQEAAGEIPAVGIPKCHGNDELVTLNSRIQFAEALI